MSRKPTSDIIIFEMIDGGYDYNTDTFWWTYYWVDTIYTITMTGELLHEIEDYTRTDYAYLLRDCDEIICGFVLSVAEFK